jgi:hypothetical protein
MVAEHKTHMKTVPEELSDLLMRNDFDEFHRECGTEERPCLRY